MVSVIFPMVRFIHYCYQWRKKVGLQGKCVNQNPAPKRKYYSVTPDGQAALRHFKNQWQLLRQNVNQVMGGVEDE